MDATALARYFRKGHFQSFRRLASGRYMGPIAKQLNGRISLFKALGRHATWYVPTVIGLYNVFDAPSEVRMQTLFEEGFGVVGGWAGTEFGAYLGGAIAIFVLGLGPLGLFLPVFLFATAFGIIGNELFRRFGSGMYDYGSQLDYGQVYHSPEQLIEAF